MRLFHFSVNFSIKPRVCIFGPQSLKYILACFLTILLTSCASTKIVQRMSEAKNTVIGCKENVLSESRYNSYRPSESDVQEFYTFLEDLYNYEMGSSWASRDYSQLPGALKKLVANSDLVSKEEEKGCKTILEKKFQYKIKLGKNFAEENKIETDKFGYFKKDLSLAEMAHKISEVDKIRGKIYIKVTKRNADRREREAREYEEYVLDLNDRARKMGYKDVILDNSLVEIITNVVDGGASLDSYINRVIEVGSRDSQLSVIQVLKRTNALMSHRRHDFSNVILFQDSGKNQIINGQNLAALADFVVIKGVRSYQSRVGESQAIVVKNVAL